MAETLVSVEGYDMQRLRQRMSRELKVAALSGGSDQ